MDKIRKVKLSDCKQLWVWRNSEHIRNCMIRDEEIVYSKHVCWFESVLQSSTSIYLIYERDGEPMGVTYFTDLCDIDKNCRWGFYIGEIGAPKGSGIRMATLSLDYIFDNYDMHKVCSEVLETNRASLNFHEKLGFIKEGYLREQHFRRNEFENVYLYGLIEQSWRKGRKDIGI